MHGGSGLSREQLKGSGLYVATVRHETPSDDPGVREEAFRQELQIQVTSGAITPDDAERLLFARRDSVLPPGARNIPVAERGLPLGGLAIGEPELP